MTREELETATNEELIDELNYCGYDSYYGEYRADIVAEIKKRMKEPCVPKDKEAADMAINALEQEPCEDCISRQAVLDMIENAQIITDGEFCGYCTEDIDINILPPVTPQQKTGYWIKHECNGIGHIECSECFTWFLESHLLRNSYCPNCGAKNGK